MDFLSTEEFEKETIDRALAGDHEAGLEALRLCRSGLDAGRLSAPLAHYLAERLNDVLEGIKPERIITSDDYRQAVLNGLRINKPRGKPADPFPEWQQQLGALAALLTKRGYKPKQIAVALCDARASVHDKTLEESDAHRIRSKWRPMQAIDDRTLLDLAGIYCEILKKYPPLK